MAAVHGVMGVGLPPAPTLGYAARVAMLPYVEEAKAIVNRFEYLP